jgi:hypothetical protein
MDSISEMHHQEALGRCWHIWAVLRLFCDRHNADWLTQVTALVTRKDFKDRPSMGETKIEQRFLLGFSTTLPGKSPYDLHATLEMR